MRKDITARKQAEEVLHKAGALQRAIFNSANFSSIATDAKGVIQIFNVGAERMLGYTAAEVLNTITPADISDPQEVIARAEALSIELKTQITPGFEALAFKASRGIEDIYELTYIRKDGSRFPAVVSVTALRDDKEAIIGYLLIGTDNTARKHAEEENKRESAVITSCFNAIPDLIFIKNLLGMYLECNPSFTEFVGRTKDDIVGKIDYELFGQEIADFFREQDDLMMKKGKPRCNEEWITYPDGRKIMVETIKAPYRDLEGRLIGMFGIARDITERNHAEQALLRSRENYLQIFENKMTAICVFDVETLQIIDVNDTLVRLYGYSREELLVGMKLFDLSTEKELTMELVRSHKSKESFSIPLRYHKKKDGTIFPVEIFGASYMRDGRQVMYGMIHDISQRKHVEEELQTISNELEQKVGERTADLEKTNATLTMMLDYTRIVETDIQERVVANLRANIMGIVDVLKKQQLTKSAHELVELLETTTLDLAHPIARNLESQLLKLTPREIQLANYIRLGKSTKDLEEMFNLSKRTIDFHRNNLRKKLGINGKKINLRTFLNSEFAK